MLSRQLTFVQELDKLKAVYRKMRLRTDNNRYENSAEHSWHTALMARVLHEYASEPVNIDRVIFMLLIHDIVEIDAGDTFAFAEQSVLEAQEGEELAAVDRIFGLLPEKKFLAFKELWMEFEQAKTADARFAKGMDRILPVIQNMATAGGSWVEHGISKTQVLRRNQGLMHIAPGLWQYVCDQVELAVAKGWLQNE